MGARAQVPIFYKERALLDAFVHLRGFGAAGLGEQILAEHPEEIDREKLVRYAEEMGRPRVMTRVRSALGETDRSGPASIG